ncbi:hypothetical protein [Streptomyces sp. NPDC088816]|uniref:hypothetical protein n=1 Tax=Streptomyces sp. NPDC088816 TaxID=3365906 RepID=UPI0037FFECF0
MTNPEWFPLATAAATALAAVVAAVVALRSAGLSSRTAFQSSYTKDRLDVVGRFLDALDAVLADPAPSTRARVKSEFLRVRVVFHPGGSPVDVAKQIVAAVDNLIGNEALKPAEEERMFDRLWNDVRAEQAGLEERGDDAEPQLKWVLEEVMRLRAEDDQAVKDGKRGPDRDLDKDLLMMDRDLDGVGGPAWLNVWVAVGSGWDREQRRKQRERHRDARNAVVKGREVFVTAVGEWLAEPPSLNGTRGTDHALPGTRWSGRLRLLRGRS